MTEATTGRLERWTARALVALPLISMALALLAWLRYGFDMPWFDDWRGYLDGSIHSLAWSHLFRATNDTLSPVGYALDALAQRHLDGNSVAYQFLSMAAVLGSLLLLQWKLLGWVLHNRFHRAICFFLTVLMLQPGSYWGLENLAYVQALPLAFILWALWLLFASGWTHVLRGPAVAALGLLAGFTYVSGAFAAFAAGAAALVAAYRYCDGPHRRSLLRDVTWFTAAAGLAMAVQFYFSVIKFDGTQAGLPLAFPHQRSFWFFYAGKLARSLLLPQDWPWTSLLVTIAVSASAALAGFLVIRRAAASTGTEQERRLVRVGLPVAALVLVYLALVAAGRTNFRPQEMRGLLEIFAYGFTRFHFFWAALLWPWGAAAILVLSSGPKGLKHPLSAFAGWAGILCLAGAAAWGGAFDHMAFQKKTAEARMPVARCLLDELQKGGEVRCQGLVPARYEDSAPDAYPAYAYARRTGASFVRQFPILPGARRRESMQPLYSLQASSAAPRMHEMKALENGRFVAVGNDPQLFLQTNKPQVTRRCMTLDVEIEMRVGEADTAQLFYVRAGEFDEYLEQSSFRIAVGANPAVFQTISLRMESDTGFFESLRFDPVTRPQEFEIRDARVYCVRERL